MLTSIHMSRLDLATKEAMEKYCKGEEDMKDSVNDDLESFFDDLRLGKKPDEYVENENYNKRKHGELLHWKRFTLPSGDKFDQ